MSGCAAHARQPAHDLIAGVVAGVVAGIRYGIAQCPPSYRPHLFNRRVSGYRAFAYPTPYLH